MKTNIISNVIAKNRTKKALLEKAYTEVGYYKKPALEKVVSNSPSFVGPMAVLDAGLLSSINHFGNTAEQIFVGALGFAAYAFRHAAVNIHKNAVDGASKLGSQMLEKGFSVAERKTVVKDQLSSGNMIFGNLFKLIYPKRVQKLADGIPTKSGFLYLGVFGKK